MKPPIKRPQPKPYQTLEERMNKLILESEQRQGKVFQLPPSRQADRMNEIINRELGYK